MANQNNSSLVGLTAVVSGASRGIGRAIALELSARGAACVVHGGHARDALEGVAEEIRRARGEVLSHLADLSNAETHEPFVDAAWGWRGGVDIWVNNAGADVLTGAAADGSFEEKLDVLLRLDVTATMRLARLVGARMKARGGGVILNIGWDQAEHGMAGDSGELFAAAKGAVTAFSRSLARSLAPEVRVNCLAPGWIRTAWGEQASEYWQARAVGECLLERWGTPEDVASAAAFLASPAAAFINGHVIPVNGGLRRA